MARIRYLKPAFFEDEHISQLPFEHRLLFAGLWCLADREGRLEDSPVTIKAKLFSSDLSVINKKVNIEKMLNDLSNGKRFILRYKIGQKGYIQILNFKKHQKPHHTERDSEIPEPQGDIELTVKEPLENGEKPEGMGNGEWGMGKGMGMVKGTMIYVNFEKLTVTTWNSFCDKYPVLKKIKSITGTRRASLKKRFSEPEFKNFSAIIEAIEEQPFLINGNPNSEKHKDWHIDFDWLIKNDTNYMKVLERKYVKAHRAGRDPVSGKSKETIYAEIEKKETK